MARLKPSLVLSPRPMANPPLRTPKERFQFCDTYLQAVGARELRRSDAYLEYELPIDVDKELTDRPYFWLWVEQTGHQVEPTVLRLAFSEQAAQRENERLRREAWTTAEARGMSEVERMFFRPPVCELITLGSFRLDKIFDSLAKRGRFACVAYDTSTHGDHMVSWLMVNIMVSFQAALTQQVYRSLAIRLDHGEVVDGFYDFVRRLPMQPAEPEQLLQRSRISVSDALLRLDNTLHHEILHSDLSWAEEARHNLQQELEQIDLYYESLLPDLDAEERNLVQAERDRKRQEVRQRSEPRIVIAYQQAALMGLPERMIHLPGTPSHKR
ncbi:YqhG family protein [Alicyclobacillus shizuokensis]|uniref:YqhG family protein n=1 Tax=Alicyclobacillus shizuokensis TaxID=392014 RepID=UPI00083183C2|nr:YqhG family protein [Alicyclobacillus shizuokensis]MCL6625384.1 YqhG family protein [Alicyclobacillus shizuokensis]